MFNGKLIDPFKEFFITINRSTNDEEHIHINQANTNQTNIWRKYILYKDKIPKFLLDDDIAQAILINGKSLQILRNLQRESNKGNKISSKPYSSSFQYFSGVLSKYYPLEYCIQVIDPKQKQSTATSPRKMLILSPTKQREEIQFASPKGNNRKHKSERKYFNFKNKNQNKAKLDAIKMMIWINATDDMFADPPKHSKPKSPFKSIIMMTRNFNTFNKYPLLLAVIWRYDETKFIHKSMVYIPFQHIDAELLPKISKYCFGVNRLLLDSIDLLPHLIAYDYFILLKHQIF